MRAAFTIAILLLALVATRAQEGWKPSPAYYPLETGNLPVTYSPTYVYVPDASPLEFEPAKWKRRRAWGIIGWNLGASVIGAVGDAVRDEGNDWGWALGGVEAGMHLSAHWVHRLRGWDEHLSYYASAALIRAGTFDITYNLSRGLPWYYTGSTKLWDETWEALNPPPHGKGFFYGWCLTLGVAIPLNEL